MPSINGCPCDASLEMRKEMLRKKMFMIMPDKRTTQEAVSVLIGFTAMLSALQSVLSTAAFPRQDSDS